MSDYEEFLRRAAYCISIARGMDAPSYKAALLEMAQRWRELAVRTAHQQKELPATSLEHGDMRLIDDEETVLASVPRGQLRKQQD